MNTVCSVAGCARPATKRQLCQTHADRKRKFGDVQADKPIREVPGTGYMNHGYLVLPVPPPLRHLTDGETACAQHRLVLATFLGRPLTAEESVHDKNGDRLGNRIESLELWSRWQPRGQRVTDKIEYAVEILQRYAAERLADQNGAENK